MLEWLGAERVRVQPAPSFGALVREASDQTTVLHVELTTGGHDLMAYDHDQVCSAVLDRYVRWAAEVELAARH